MMSFSVMRSLDRGPVKVGQRIARWEPLNLPIRSTRCRGSGKQERKVNPV
jgi:hypothetical protein